jgi:methylthioribulose-1-phosphate dehydratase
LILKINRVWLQMTESNLTDETHENTQASLFNETAGLLADIGHAFYQRGWVLGTSGNFSSVLGQEPLRLAITESGVDKGLITPANIVEVDEKGSVLSGAGRASAETLLHIAVVRCRGAGAVLHTHSVWSNILSEAGASQGWIEIQGYEMLKGLAGIQTHNARELLPIIENSQDMTALSGVIARNLDDFAGCHGFLLRRHGLYTWGQDLAEAKRHVEIFEFLLEVIGRTRALAGPH